MLSNRFPVPAMAVLATAAVAMSGCARNALPIVQPSGAGSVPSGAAPSAIRLHKADVAVRVFIPRRPRHLSGRRVRPFFVATTTQGIAILVSVHGSSTVSNTTNAGVAPSSPLCHAVTGGRTCTIPAAAPAGSDDFVVKTYDAQPSRNGFSGAKQLAIGSTTKTIAAGKQNSLNVTVGGVVAKGAVNLSWPANPVIDKDTQTVTVSALDADGNTIVNDGWYDAAGIAVTFTLQATNGGPTTFTFAPTHVGFSAPTSTLTYDSTTVTSSQVQNGFTSSISATPSNGGTAGSATFTLSKPAFTEFPVSTSSSYPEGITVGPDSAIWFTENLGNKIGRITTSASAGTNPTEFNGLTPSAGPIGIATSADDGKLWFTESCLGKVASIDPTSHTVNEHLTPAGSSSFPYGIAPGPDGNMWFTENASAHSNVGKFNASALDGGLPSIVEYAPKTASSSPESIVAGPDGNMWFTENGVDKIGTITTAGSNANDFTTGSNTLGDGKITTGPDGALWFSEENPNSGHSIGRITTGASVTLPHTFTNTFTSAMGIVTGPDGALWFAENGNNAIGRIDPTTHTVVEFTVPTSTSNPWGIVKGPDGALWFTECLGNKIGKLQ